MMMGVDVQVITCDGNVGHDDGDDHETGFDSTDLFPPPSPVGDFDFVLCLIYMAVFLSVTVPFNILVSLLMRCVSLNVAKLLITTALTRSVAGTKTDRVRKPGVHGQQYNAKPFISTSNCR